MINGRAESESQTEAVAEACVSCSCEISRKKRQVGMLTDADERMKWNGMSTRLAEAGSKTSQSAKTSAEPKRERERAGEQLDILAWALTNTHTHANTSEDPRQQSPLRWRSSASALTRWRSPSLTLSLVIRVVSKSLTEQQRQQRSLLIWLPLLVRCDLPRPSPVPPFNPCAPFLFLLSVSVCISCWRTQVLRNMTTMQFCGVCSSSFRSADVNSAASASVSATTAAATASSA